ncbi:MAG: nucleotidyltransferase [Deltaproteobacteria bacterium]|nr:nucleotidyltransferase [Deltaproteobacteria bacterium]
MKDLQILLKLLLHSPVDFVLVGGFAAILHGSQQTTRDIDICILYSPEQISLLRDLLKPFHPYYRMEKVHPPFTDIPDHEQDLHLGTDLGDLDIIRHVKGVGGFYDVLKNTREIEMYGGKCRLISIDDLIKAKKALGRHRDLATATELEAIRDQKE